MSRRAAFISNLIATLAIIYFLIHQAWAWSS